MTVIGSFFEVLGAFTQLAIQSTVCVVLWLVTLTAFRQVMRRPTWKMGRREKRLRLWFARQIYPTEVATSLFNRVGELEDQNRRLRHLHYKRGGS